MFVDPINTVSVSLPPSWAFDPMFSSLTRLIFVDWASPGERRFLVDVIPSLIGPGNTDDQWEMAVRANLPATAARIERRPGPAIIVELPGNAERPDSRLAWVRGPRLGALIEQQGVPLGGALLTPELAEALRTLKVPVNHRVVEQRTKTEWGLDMLATVQALKVGIKNSAVRHLNQAIKVAEDAWLHSLIGRPIPDIPAAVAAAEAMLRLARVTESVELLYHATTTLLRCRRSLASIPMTGTPTNQHLDELIDRALWLHGEFENTPSPTDPMSACLARCRLCLRDLAVFLENNRSKSDGVSWLTLANLANLACEDAMTAVAQATLGATLHYSDLSEEAKATMAANGISDDTSLRKVAKEQEIAALDHLASCGHALGSVKSAAVSGSASAVRANALLAARRVAKLAPSHARDRNLVHAINAYAGSLHEFGDEPSIKKAQILLAEAQSILNRLGDESELRATMWNNEGQLLYEQGNIDRGLAIAGRAIAAARQSKSHRTENKARCLRSRLLSLAGHYSEAIAEARDALAASDDDAASIHLTLATAFHGAGDSAAALEEIRVGLALALPDNPLSDVVHDLLALGGRVLEPTDTMASLVTTEVAEVVFEARRRDIGGVGEQIAYDDAAHHRELAAALVQRRLDAGDMLGALVTADRHRARSLTQATGSQGGPSEGNHQVKQPTLPSADASLADQVGFASSVARAVLARWGIPPPLDGSVLTGIVANHGRTVVLFHPIGTQLRYFIIRPETPVIVTDVIVKASFPRILSLTDALRQQLGIVVAARAARGQLPPQSIDDLIKDLTDDDEVSAADTKLNELRGELHDALFSEVLPLLHDKEPVAVVPYRELAVIPLTVLTGSHGRTLIERHPLSILPSIASLGAFKQSTTRQPRAVVIGNPDIPETLGLNPLTGAAVEAEHVVEMLTNAGIDTSPLLGPEATEAKFRTSAAGARVVHLACHAALREPASASPLFLTPSRNDDGLLLPAEIADLRLDGALVVLAACQSGLGRVTADGVLGLGRAFMQAGAQALVLSLWRVGDAATAHIMREFYNGLLGTAQDVHEPLDVAAAMRRAQLEASNRLSDHPSVWGPWLVVGDGGWRLA